MTRTKMMVNQPKSQRARWNPIASTYPSWVRRPPRRISTPTVASKTTSRPMNSGWFGATTAPQAVVTQPK